MKKEIYSQDDFIGHLSSRDTLLRLCENRLQYLVALKTDKPNDYGYYDVYQWQDFGDSSTSYFSSIFEHLEEAQYDSLHNDYKMLLVDDEYIHDVMKDDLFD